MRCVFIAYRSMRTLPGFGEFRGNFLAPSDQRRSDIAAINGQWKSGWAIGTRSTPEEVLLNSDGSFRLEIIQRLLAARDNRSVVLNE